VKSTERVIDQQLHSSVAVNADYWAQHRPCIHRN